MLGLSVGKGDGCALGVAEGFDVGEFDGKNVGGLEGSSVVVVWRGTSCWAATLASKDSNPRLKARLRTS